MGKQINITDEERERRRQNAFELKEKGLIGPQFGKLGGRPKKPRASETIAEEVSKQGEAIFERLIDIVKDGKNAEAINAAMALLKVEEQERKIIETEVINLEQAKRNELLEFLSKGLQELAEAGVVIEGWAGDITDAEFEGIGESLGSPEETIE